MLHKVSIALYKDHALKTFSLNLTYAFNEKGLRNQQRQNIKCST